MISFSVQEARNQLLKEGIVYTFRWKRRKKTGKDWATDKRNNPKIADVYIEEIGRVRANWNDLEMYATQSGFKDAIQWYLQIQKMPHKGGLLWGWLYKVTIRSKGERIK